MRTTTIVVIGVEISLNDDEMELIENRKHSVVKRLREVGLDFYWGNFDLMSGEKFLLLAGKVLSKLELENENEAALSCDQIFELIQETREKLLLAGIQEEPSLILRLQPS